MPDKAILFGINTYKSISGLNGCVNDLQDVRRLLIDEYGFAESNIRLYTNEQVIRDTVEKEFDWLATDTGAGDRVLFHFSGHGSYTTSKSPDKDVDELLCLWDMDWGNEASFLRDTDLGALTRRVDTGARLTVILDSCHSGTGTRAFTSKLRGLAKRVTSQSPLVIVADTAKRLAMHTNEADVGKLERGIESARAATMTQLRDETPPVLARFVSPPLSIQTAVAAKAGLRVRSMGQSMRTLLNHQLLAAAGEKQTAADAFIDGQYRGAFSFHLCATVRLQPTKSFGEIMQVVTQRIKQQGFTQDPQIEGPFTQESFLGSGSASASPTVPTSPATPAEPTPTAPTSPGICVCPCSQNPGGDSSGDADGYSVEQKQVSAPTDAVDPLATLDRLLSVSEKLIDLASRRGPERMAQPSAAPTRAAAAEVIIYVHGISEHLPGYSLIWHQALAPHLNHPIRTAEVRWSQLVNARAVTPSGAVVGSAEEKILETQIQAELERRTQRYESMANRRLAGAGPVEARGVVAMERSRSFAVDDFTRYMLFEATREAILNEFFKIVVPELEAGAKVHIVSHSWGTVVAYEGLRRLDSRQLPGRVSTLVTAGSALSIGAVQSNLFGRVGDGRTPKHVETIINVDAGGDVVGGPIGHEFTVDHEFLGVDPTGCRKIPFTGIAFNPACAHRSYFLKDNRAVNRDIFAKYI